ncbi:hypothetical protein ACFVSK_21160 [Cellulosimicrobium cellulans]|uniref:hypothetical protein n=1 Tax=Cellulosimicrobium cellulans TaxID=1710 RepID=UPI0036EB1091
MKKDVIIDVSLTTTNAQGMSFSLYHIIWNNRHYIHSFKDGNNIELELFEDIDALENKIKNMIENLNSGRLKSDFKLSEVNEQGMRIIGHKVIPQSKSVKYMQGLTTCQYWKDAVNSGQNFLYIVDTSGKDYDLNSEPPKNYNYSLTYNENINQGYRSIGNYYSESDLIFL